MSKAEIILFEENESSKFILTEENALIKQESELIIQDEFETNENGEYLCKNDIGPDDRNDLIFDCGICEENFSTIEQLSFHIQFHSTTSTRPMLSFETPNSQMDFQCDECSNIYTSKEELDQYSLVHSEKPLFICTRCKRSFQQEINFDNHMRMHNEDEIYKFEENNESFTEKFNLTSHTKKPASEEKSRCDMTTNSEKKRFKCEKCNKSYSTKADLKRHSKVHPGVERHVDINTRSHSVKTKYTLRKRTKEKARFDIQTHSGEKRYKCEKCDKSYSTKANLKRHVKLHSVQKK